MQAETQQYIKSLMYMLGGEREDHHSHRRQGAAIRLCLVLGGVGLYPDAEKRGKSFCGNHPKGDFTEAEMLELWKLGQQASIVIRE